VVFRKLNSPVHHPSSSPRGAFHLLAVFRRHTFRLSEASVSLALHSILGGAPAGFHVTCFRDHHFRFSVASRHVSFMIRDLNRVTTTHFDVYFHLWREGGGGLTGLGNGIVGSGRRKLPGNGLSAAGANHLPPSMSPLCTILCRIPPRLNPPHVNLLLVSNLEISHAASILLKPLSLGPPKLALLC
jgi:hypothetical protein